MDHHTLELGKVCRFCCKKIILSKHYKILKLVIDRRDDILTLFGHDKSLDDPKINPGKLCKDCSRKLDSGRSGLYQMAEIAVFDKHESGKCIL